MRGKTKCIKRSELYVGNQAYQHSHDLHDIRMTCLYAETYEGYLVLIDEKDVLSYYGRQRFSDSLISDLNSQLHNKVIEFDKNEEGDNYLTGNIGDYII